MLVCAYCRAVARLDTEPIDRVSQWVICEEPPGASALSCPECYADRPTGLSIPERVALEAIRPATGESGRTPFGNPPFRFESAECDQQ
jgi:hypothetical protein